MKFLTLNVFDLEIEQSTLQAEMVRKSSPMPMQIVFQARRSFKFDKTVTFRISESKGTPIFIQTKFGHPSAVFAQ